MIMYGPYIAVVFWGAMIFFGFRSAFMTGKGGPLIPPLRSITGKFGVLTWAAVVILYVVVLVLARVDSENIRQMKSPVGIATSLAFIPLILADALLAAQLFLKETPPQAEAEPPPEDNTPND